MSESAGVAITTVLSILVIVDVVGNSVVCAIIKRNRDMRTPINYLLKNVAVADITYAVFIVPGIFFKVYSAHHPDGPTGAILCKLVTGGNFAWVGSVASFVTLVAIAIERYFAVMYPHGSKWKLTKRKLKVIIPGSWVFALMFTLPEFFVRDILKTKDGNLCLLIYPDDWMGKAYSVAWLVVVDLSLLVMVVLYSRVVYTLWFKRDDNNQLTDQQKGVVRVRKRVTIMVVIVTAIFGICWGTNSLLYVLIEHVADNNIGPVPLAIVNIMVLFNSAVNPFVYALFNQQFREKMKKMICCTGFSAPVVHPMPEAQDIELADSTTHPTHTVGPCSTE
ncbi:hypothetical protein ACROYT_G038852 [Oculina patagonica]